MSLVADAIVYVLILLGVLAIVAASMYTVAHLRKPEDPTRTYRGTGQGAGTQRTA